VVPLRVELEPQGDKPAQGAEIMLEDSRTTRPLDHSTTPTAGGALVVDETGERKDAKATAPVVGKQYLGAIGKIDHGVVSAFRAWGSRSDCTIRLRSSPTLRRTTSRAPRTILPFAPSPR
jgi:hypothetical protein